MNYLKWSKEYEQTAMELDKVVQRLKEERRHAQRADYKELTDRITHFRWCRKECLSIAQHLRDRHKGVA